MTTYIEKMVERQVFLNSKLDTILEIDPPDKKYKGFLTCLDSNADGSKVTWENVEDYTPFLELLILRDLLGSYSYRLIVSCHEELDKTNWRRLRDRTNKILEDFEYQKTETKGRLFHTDKVNEEEDKRKSDEIISRMRLSIKVKKQYQELQEELKRLLKEGATLNKIAGHYGLKEQIVKEFLHSTSTGKPTPAELAKKILVDSSEAKALGLYQISQLEDEVLNRRLGEAFPQRKRCVSRKRLLVRPTAEEIEKFFSIDKSEVESK